MFTRKNESKNQLLEKFAHSYNFLFIIAVIFFLGWYFESGIALIVAASIGILIPLLISRDGEILGSILMIGLFSLPTFPLFDTIPWYLYAEVGIFVFGLIAFLIKKIVIKDMNLNVGSIGVGLLLLGIALTASTIVRQYTSYNEPSEFNNWAYLATGMLGLIIFAYFVFHMTSGSDNAELIQKTFYTVSMLVLAECIYALVMSKINGYEKINFDYTKWGNPNTVALVLEICLPFLALIFCKNKFRIDTLLMILLSYVFILGADSRGGIACSTLLIPLLIFIMFRDMKNRRYVNAIVLVTFSILSIIAYMTIPEVKYGIDNWFTQGTDLSSRDIIWEYSYGFAKNNLLFGGGIQSLFDMFPIFWQDNLGEGQVGIWLAHNTFFTIVAAGGWLAVTCYIYHLVELFVTTQKSKFYVREVLYYFILVGLIHGLVDNTFFNIIYMVPYFWIFSFKDFKGIPYTKKLK